MAERRFRIEVVGGPLDGFEDLISEPPPDALEWQRVETKGFLIFLPPGLRLPKELHLAVKGLLTRRVEAFWEGCAYMI